jgi:hypothetical protein
MRTDTERIEELEDVLRRIQQWCDAYPIGLFVPVSTDDMKRADTLLRTAGISMGAMHAQWGRHILQGIGDIIKMRLQ